MSISSEISRITGNVANAYSALLVKGATMPSVRNTANLAGAIESIPEGVAGEAMSIETIWAICGYDPEALPNGYTLLEYIQSSGTQYIDTGFKPTGAKYRAVLSFRYTTTHSGLSLFGNSTSSPFSITVYGAKPVFYVGSTNALSCGDQTSLNTDYVLDVTANNGTLTAYWNGTKCTASYSGSLCTTRNVFIFGSNSGSIAETGNGYRLYSFQIYDNDILVRDFVPCINPSGVYGLYDKANSKFYGNAGSGAFTGG